MNRVHYNNFSQEKGNQKMSDAPAIYKLMPQVIRDVGAIPKANRNKAQGYSFRSVDDLLNVLHPVVVKHDVTISIEVTEYKTETIVRNVPGKAGMMYRATLLMRVSFWAEDGSNITSTAAGEGLDFGSDKATNKAMSAAFKYACFFGLAIPFVDVDDSDRSAKLPPEPASATKSSPPGAASSASAPTSSQELMADALAPLQLPPDVSGSDPATAVQRDRIKNLAKQLGMSREGFLKVLEKRHVKQTNELTIDQAADLQLAMGRKLQEKEKAANPTQPPASEIPY